MRADRKFIIILILSVLTGWFLAWADSRPRWDDAGVTAGLVVLIAALFGYLQPNRPWIWALTVSCWIPLYAILVTGNFKMSLVIFFGFAGSYLGAAVKKNKPSPE